MERSTARLGYVKGTLGLCCALVCTSLISHGAAAADATDTNPDAGKKFATVLRIKGDISASAGTSGADRPLREGDVVRVGERVKAAPAAEAVLKTEDAGMMAVRPGSEFVAERFAAEGKPTDSFSVRLLNGSLRIISGWIGKLNRGGHQVVTAQATIGIRGTDHEPYVLSADMAKATSNREGTYDKVNRGGTTIDADGQKLDVDPGRVGFAPKKVKQRAMFTLLLPVLLEKVPDFYVPGAFDAELDRYSQTADEESSKQLEQKRRAAQAPAAECAPDKIAKTWLGQLDRAIVKRDANAIVAMFAPEVTVRATVRTKDGGTETVELGRDELAQSTVAAVKDLKGYKQRRISIEAKPADAGDGASACDRINVKSVVIEQGRQAGKPYRFESTEAYVLELRAGTWLATKVETTQR